MNDYKVTVKDIICLIIIIILFLYAGHLEYEWQQEEAEAGYTTIEEVR